MSSSIDRLSAWCHWSEIGADSDEYRKLMASDIRVLIDIARAAEALKQRAKTFGPFIQVGEPEYNELMAALMELEVNNEA